MKILIVSDAWQPQVNGVVRMIEALSSALQTQGHTVLVLGPDPQDPLAFPAPTYPSITLDFGSRPRLKAALNKFAPDLIHIATEGPLGFAMRRLCLQRSLAFTTSYHTRFPDYIAARVPHLLVPRLLVPRLLAPALKALAYAYLRFFHNAGNATLVPTPSIQKDLAAQGFTHLALCPNGVNVTFFAQGSTNFAPYADLPRPILLYVGRVSIEKNIEEFLSLSTKGSLIVIGDGPARTELQNKYPAAHFLGTREGPSLADAYASADLFVFPSRTDTFGLVLLEASAAGLRLAALPVSGPKDVLDNAPARAFAVLAEPLQAAVDAALALPQDADLPRAFAALYDLPKTATTFLSLIARP